MGDVIREIKERLRLEECMQESGVEFVRKGPESWSARCWRHKDEKPSLVVSVRKGLFNCFSTGCGAGGDVISFYEQFESCDRSTAIAQLAARLGVETSKDGKSEIHEIMRLVTDVCNIELFSNKKALRYCASRGVSEEAICAFQIGYSKSPAWLKSAVTSAPGELWKSMELDSYKYRDSLVFPCIHPISGQIAHYVRPFGESSSKYMGPSSTNPTRWPGMMFGLQVARGRYRDEGLVLVEGQFDCLVLSSHGINSVCLLGSHPQPAQFELLKSINIAAAAALFDGDLAGKAGNEAAIKAIPGGFRLSIASMPEGDPDEFLLRDGGPGLRRIIAGALLPADYIISKWKGKLSGDAGSISEGLAGAIGEFSTLDRADRLAGLIALSRVSGVSVESLEDIDHLSRSDLKDCIESEKQVLAMCVKNPECVHLVNGLGEAFTLGKHKQALQRIKELTQSSASEITDELLGACGIGLSAIEPTNFEYHIGLIKDAHSRRQLALLGKRLYSGASDCRTPTPELVASHLREVSQSASPTDRSEYTAAEVVDSAIEYVHGRMEHPDTIPGLDLGPAWRNTTKVLLGLQENRLYLLGAGPKVGKTSLALNWAIYQAVTCKVPTLWVNLEMSERDLIMRGFSMMSGLSSLRVQAGALGAKEKELLDSHAADLYSSPLHILNGFGMTVQEIISAMRKYVFKHKIRLAFIDYIQLLNVSGGSRLDYWERHAEISTALKGAINADLGMPVVALSQLGRPAAAEGSSSGSFIGGSYKYVQDADCFMGLRVRSDKELEDGLGGNLVLNVEYNRHGPQDVYTRIFFNRDTLRMEEIE